MIHTDLEKRVTALEKKLKAVAGKKFSQFTTITTPSPSDEVVGLFGGNNNGKTAIGDAVFNSVQSGDNMTITQPGGPGTRVRFDSTGGSPSVYSTYGSFSVDNSNVSTTITAVNTLYPISVNASNIHPLSSSNFVIENVVVSGVFTPVMRYTDEATQFLQLDWNLFVRGAEFLTPQVQTFLFYICIYKANNTITVTQIAGRAVCVNATSDEVSVPLSGIVSLSTGDRVFIQAKNPTATNNPVVTDLNAKIVNLDAASQSTLQSAYSNGNGVIQGDLDAKPLIVRNSTSQIVFEAKNNLFLLPKNYGTWNPTITAISGISGAITPVQSCRFLTTGTGVICILYLTLTATDWDIQFTFTLPIASTFTDALHATLMGAGVLTAATPALGDGQVIDAYSVPSGNLIRVAAISAAGSGVKKLKFSCAYDLL